MNLTEVAEKFSKTITNPGPDNRVKLNYDKLLPIERDAMHYVYNHNASIELDAQFKPYNEKYKAFDLSCLSMRRFDKNLGMNVPMFAVYDAFDDETVFNVRERLEYGDGDIVSKSKVDLEINILDGLTKPYYSGLFKMPFFAKHGCLQFQVIPTIVIGTLLTILAYQITNPLACSFTMTGLILAPIATSITEMVIHCNRKLTRTLSAMFTGVIPDQTRKMICDVKKEFTKVLLISEATQWSFNKQDIVEMKPSDPLVVGLARSNSGEYRCYLIGQFDPTPIEDWAKREFATKVGSPAEKTPTDPWPGV